MLIRVVAKAQHQPTHPLVTRQVLYKKLGAKLAVGMPFKDIATSDSILMREIPPSSDAEGRRALRRLQEVTVHVIVPADKLAADPLPGAVALHSLKDAVVAHKAGGVKLPQVNVGRAGPRSGEGVEVRGQGR